MIQLTQIPWSIWTGNPRYGFQNFVRKFLGIDTSVCCIHFGPIGAKYEHAKISDAKYRKDEFCEHMLAFSKLINQGVAKFQALSITYATRARTNRGRVPADWEWSLGEWTGPIKGSYTKADWGIFVLQLNFVLNCIQNLFVWQVPAAAKIMKRLNFF